MTLPLTDEFLLKVYEKLENFYDKIDIFPKSFRESASPDFKMLRKIYERRKRERTFSQFIYYLKKKGYIKIKNLEGKEGILLTKKGVEKALKAKLRSALPKEKKLKRRKDGRCEMVAFDIPERKRKLRDYFRFGLQGLGYIKFQQSIWISPFEVMKETEKLIRELSLKPYVRIFLIKEIEV